MNVSLCMKKGEKHRERGKKLKKRRDMTEERNLNKATK